jgi:nitrous oxidase accessory protein
MATFPSIPLVAAGRLAWPVAAVIAGLLVTPPAQAAEVRVGAGDSLQQAISMAKPGDTIRVAAGTYKGVTAVTVPNLTLIGEGRPVLDGEGRGTVVMILAPGVTMRGFRVTNSGTSPYGDDSGIRLENAPGGLIADNHLDTVWWGINVKRSPKTVVTANTVTGGAPPGRYGGWGDGIRIWSSAESRVTNNRVSRFRDGLYLEFSNQSRADDNQVQDCQRYGLHFMYMNGSDFRRNTFTGSQAGSVLMYSQRIQVEDNVFANNRGPIGQGVLYKENDDGSFRRNRILNNTVGMFIDASDRNRIDGNTIAGNGWGVLLFSSATDNAIQNNAFYANNYAVAVDMATSRNRLDGNYWSDYRGYDLNADGRGDEAYSPVSMFAFLAMQYPDLYAYIGSPAVKALDFAQRLIPALSPSDLRDARPLMAPPMVPRNQTV